MARYDGNNILIYRGDDEAFKLTFTDSAGSAVDITGYTVWMTVKTNETDTDANAQIQKKVTSHTNASGGISQVDMTDDDTDISIGTYYYDIQIKDGSGLITTILKAKFIVEQDITTNIT